LPEGLLSRWTIPLPTPRVAQTCSGASTGISAALTTVSVCARNARRAAPAAALLTHADQLKSPRPASAVDKQAVNRSQERHRAARHARELEQPMGQRFAVASALELLAGDRTPRLIDDTGRLA
jgi:hypothetical protein